MMLKSKITPIFFALGLSFFLLSLSRSGALSQGRMERSTTANVVADDIAVLKLEGFNNPKIYNINKKYVSISSITNNTNQLINLTVTIMPDFSLVNKKKYWLSVKIGDAVSDFQYGSSSSQQVTLSLTPGQVVDVEAALSNNQSREVITVFNFTATDTTGTYTMQLNDTYETPRRISCK